MQKITTTIKYSTFEATAKKQFRIILEDAGDVINILNNPNSLFLDTNFIGSISKEKIIF